MRTRLPAILAAAAIVLTATACSADPTAQVAEPVTSGTWTVLTYSIADTNLEPFMMTDLEELGDVGTQPGLNLVALVDRSSDYSDDPVLGLDNWSGGKLLEIGKNQATVLADEGNIDTGDPAVLADFIATGIKAYPAEHYALIISDHGASWPGVGADGSFEDDGLSLAEINSGIADGLSTAGVDKLDMLGFDACLMATYEVASTLAPLADRLVASQELEPGHGWDYTALDTIAEDGKATVDELASAVIAGFKAQAESEGDESDITLAEIDLTRMDTVDAALKAFTDVLVNQAAAIGPTVGRTLAATLGFGKSPDPSQDTFMTDLAGFTSQVGVDLLFSSDAADALTRAINDVVLDKVDGQATKGATGLSIYFPPQVDYFDSGYRDLPNTGGWVDFLTAYYGEGAGIPDDHRPTLADPDVTFDENGVTITVGFDQATADNLSEAYIRYGIIEADGSTTFLGEQSADLFDDNTASGTYDLTTLNLSDGQDTTGAYLALYPSEDAGVVVADVPLSYYSPDGTVAGDLLLDAVIDSATGETLSSTYYTYDDASATYGEFSSEPDWIVVPQVLNVAPDGTEEWVLTSEVGLYADLGTLVYSFNTLPSGTRLYIELNVIDFGGNYATASKVVTIP
ncbi:MAG: hypothetical protein JWP19_496 [Rhodoglobus sp.]|nr:hypothetical protein [Rhodoglobus sp.]